MGIFLFVLYYLDTKVANQTTVPAVAHSSLKFDTPDLELQHCFVFSSRGSRFALIVGIFLNVAQTYFISNFILLLWMVSMLS